MDVDCVLAIGTNIAALAVGDAVAVEDAPAVAGVFRDPAGLVEGHLP